MSISTTVFLALTALVLYHYVLQPAFFSPLASVPPAHWSARFSRIWILWARLQRRESRTIHAAHRRLGRVVRLGPAELSVNDLVDIKTVYTGGWEKSEWYLLFTNYSGTPNMFTLLRSQQHSQRKRQLSNVYAKSYLQRSAEMQAIVEKVIKRQFLGQIDCKISSGESIEVYDLLSRTAMDVVSAYIFGLPGGTKMLDEPVSFQRFMKVYAERGKHAFIHQELPGLLPLAKLFSFPPYTSQVTHARNQTDQFCSGLCNDTNERIESGSVENEEAIVFRQLNKYSKRDISSPRGEFGANKEVASELLDHLLAGFETTAIALTYALYQLSVHKDAQNELRRELRTLKVPFGKSSQAPVPSSTEVDRLPFLDAVVMETLRLNPSIPGPQPRVSPAGAYLNGYGPLPAGIRVSAQAYSLHRNEEVFPEPERWDPYRWIHGDGVPEMMRWFWAFSSGGRMCIGSNLALLESKMILAAVYTNYETSVEDTTGIQQEDIYTAGPTGKVILGFDQV